MSLINIINELAVSNINDSIEFYKNLFGFEIEYVDGNPTTWVQMKKGNIRIMLEDYFAVKKEINKIPPKLNSSNIMKFEYDNLEEYKLLYDKCKNNLCEFFIEYTETDYGKIEFGILDPDNNMLLISYKI